MTDFTQDQLDTMDAEDYSFYLAYGLGDDEDLHVQELLDQFYVAEDTIPEECPY